MKPIDETTLLRFASGEMDAAEESAFLAQCEVTPEAWRESVLAVAEHRRMVEALGELAAEESPAPAGVEDIPNPIFADLSAASDAPTYRTKTARVPARQGGIWRTLPVAAASLAVGLVVGFLTMHAARPGGPQQPQIVQEQTPAAATPKEPAPAAVPSTAVANATPEKSPERPAAAPAPDREIQPAALAKHGLEVEDEPTLYVVTAANGTRWAVPTERTTVHFVKH